MVKPLRIIIASWAIILLMGQPLVQAQDTLTWTGDLTTARAFMADLALLYQAERDTSIALTEADTSAAIMAVSAGEFDMGGAAREAIPTARGEMRVASYPIVWDALVPIVHPDNPVRNLSLMALADILTGEIDNWQEVGGPDRTIRLLGYDNRNEGVAFVTRRLILQDEDARLAMDERFDSTENLEQAVLADPTALAISTYSSARNLETRLLAVEGVSARTATIQSGDYLLYMPLYLVMREDGANRRYVRRFLKFAQGAKASRVLRRNGVVPYPDGLSLVSQQMDRENRIARLLDQN